jgi:hypothetical protein
MWSRAKAACFFKLKIMSWNHRILAHEQHGDEPYFMIHEVHYDKDGNPEAYTEKGVPVGGNSIKDITWVLNKMLACRKKPILSAGKNFPTEYGGGRLSIKNRSG